MSTVSIIIPTCNRSDYLLCAIREILSRVEDVEIIVSDNSDTDAIRSLLAIEIERGLVQYAFIPERVSVVENFERAVLRATGEYVICIGDDDCVGAGFNEVVIWAKENNIDAVFSYADRFIANYFWPGIKSKYFGDGYQAKLFLKPYSWRKYKIKGTKALAEAAQNLGGGLGCMPRIYHGLVKRDVLEKIRRKYGSIFGGVSPDIYSSTLISLESDLIFRIDGPFVLPGGSPKSTAGKGAAHTDRSNLYDVEHISRFGSSLVWTPVVPAYYGPHNVWAHSMICALKTADIKNIKPNYMSLLLKAWIGDQSYSKEIFLAMKIAIRERGISSSFIDFIKACFNESKNLVRRVIWKFLAGGQEIGQLMDIGAALNYIEQSDKVRNLKIKDLLDHRLK